MDILSIGEPLFEFSAASHGPLEDVSTFETGFGGDTSNVMIAAARMGANAGYICRIGDDAFGKQLLKLWRTHGVDTRYIITDNEHPTGIYFISRDDAGHHFSYYRKDSAASHLNTEDIPAAAIQAAKVLHLSGITQAISTSACDAVFHAIELAKQDNVTVTYDPNLRLKLWDIGRARAIILETVRQADIVLGGLEEFAVILNEDKPKRVIDRLQSLGAATVVLKLGAHGVMYTAQSGIQQVEPISVELVDATGAGDTFDGAMCAAVAKGWDLDKSVRFANVAAALSVTKVGATGSIPSLDEVMQYF